jgi:hypothetical protein
LNTAQHQQAGLNTAYQDTWGSAYKLDQNYGYEYQFYSQFFDDLGTATSRSVLNDCLDFDRLNPNNLALPILGTHSTVSSLSSLTPSPVPEPAYIVLARDSPLIVNEF